ncbi:6-phosphogluconolactonase [Scopulibacillus darangshiensis]|uniref:6-phosphogluconolactonase n=1 Tax=Scopulibacillus darangshiensis TaxID=442528 RepID=A0A4R2P539_9BACL|nr:lactonase family protein [Scopulibacillus darangshiensis]TCP29787.1 6-phosphogluconolactonase [Scopulibacillus darangshiensis]
MTVTVKNEFIGFVGTYTKGESEGIYSFLFDADKGEIRDVKPAAQLDNPTYLTISKDNRYLYSVIKKGDYGGVAGFSIDAESGGRLDPINSQLQDGASPCHVSVNSQISNVLTANYHKGTVESYLINGESGFINPTASIVKHEGSGPNKERQEKSHLHFAGFTPDEKFVAAIDLGADNVMTYKVHDGKLTEVNRLSVKPGSGPRHIAFHPNGKYAYVMTEMSSEVIALKYNNAEGSFTELQYISTIPEDFSENNQGSAIHISSDGGFVYAGNRGHDSIAVFKVNQESGHLEMVVITSTEGEWPRDFVLDPTENFLVASNQNSGNLVLFSRDKSTGKLELLQSNVSVPDPVCVKFLHA